MIKQHFIDRFEKIAEDGPELKDIPYIALFIFTALIVVLGEIGCIIWAVAILVGVIMNGVSELVWLLPCLVLFSILTAIIVFVLWGG